MKRKIRHIVQTIKQSEHNGLFLAAALLLLMVAGSVYKRQLPIRKIKLNITNTSTKQRLITKQDVADIFLKVQQGGIKKLKVKDIDFRGLENALEEHASIQDAEVFLDMTNVLHIRIQQRMPIARIVDDNGGQYYVDTEGYRVPLSKYCSYRVPVVTGVIPSDIAQEGQKLNSPLFDKLTAFLNTIHRDKILNALTEQVYLDTHNDVTIVPKTGYKRIFFGPLNNVQEKMDKLKKFYKKGDWGKYEKINLEYKNLVFAKKQAKRT